MKKTIYLDQNCDEETVDIICEQYQETDYFYDHKIRFNGTGERFETLKRVLHAFGIIIVKIK